MYGRREKSHSSYALKTAKKCLHGKWVFNHASQVQLGISSCTVYSIYLHITGASDPEFALHQIYTINIALSKLVSLELAANTVLNEMSWAVS